MNKYSALVWSIIIALMVLAVSACDAGPANISDAYMARDPEGNDPTTLFYPIYDFYCIVELSNAPDDTVVRAVWTAVDVEGEPPNTEIDEVSGTTGEFGDQVSFDLTAPGLWPAGRYKVDLFLNDEQEPARTLEFEVVPLGPQPDSPVPDSPVPDPPPGGLTVPHWGGPGSS